MAAGGVDHNFLVDAYDLATGKFLWSDEEDSGFEDNAWDEAKAVVIRGSSAFVTGELAAGTDGDSRNDYTRAYDLDTGTVLWTSQIDTGGFDFLDAIAIRQPSSNSGWNRRGLVSVLQSQPMLVLGVFPRSRDGKRALAG